MPEAPFPVYLFRLRVVTPLFLGGAAPNERAELRPASIKGVLRDWYRVLVGPDRAAEEEARLFGGTLSHTGQSPFLLAVDGPLTGEEPWRPPKGGRDIISGLNYLGYSLNLGKDERKERKERKAIPSGRELMLEAAFPRGASNDFEEQRRALIACLWLLTHLGGLGSRARRGFGSLAWEGSEFLPWDGDKALQQLPLLVESSDATAAAGALAEGLAVLDRWFPGSTDGSAAEDRRLGFRLAGARLLVVRGPNRAGAWDRPLDALEHIGAEMQRFRRQPGIDGFATAQILDRGELPPRAPARTAFGLPLSYRTRKGTYTFEPYLPAERTGSGAAGSGRRGGQEYHRYPSPLLLHVQQLRGGYVPVVTLLGGARPGRDLPLRLHPRGCPEDPENRLLEDFLDRLREGGAEKVRR